MDGESNGLFYKEICWFDSPCSFFGWMACRLDAGWLGVTHPRTSPYGFALFAGQSN